jgi:hypothetical protein
MLTVAVLVLVMPSTLVQPVRLSDCYVHSARRGPELSAPGRALLLFVRCTAVLVRVMLRSLVGVMAGMGSMTMRHMGMVAAFFVAGCCMMLRRFPMVMSGVLMMLSSFGMVFSTLMLHGLPPDVLDGE